MFYNSVSTYIVKHVRRSHKEKEKVFSFNKERKYTKKEINTSLQKEK